MGRVSRAWRQAAAKEGDDSDRTVSGDLHGQHPGLQSGNILVNSQIAKVIR
jgi:hypothetical protein